MNFVDLFAGIGGAALGLEAAGWTCVAHSEIEDYPRRILRQHWPKVPLYGDIKEICGKDLPAHDVISAGVPCQGNSTAGTRLGVHDERWLWPEVRRLVDECRPRYLIVENPPGLLSVNKGEAFAQVLGDLDVLGYACEWTVFSAARLGARHLRKRVWVVAYPDGDGGGQRGPGRLAGGGARVPDEARGDGAPGTPSDPHGERGYVGGHRAGQDGGEQPEPAHLRRGQGAGPSAGDRLGRARGPDNAARREGRLGLGRGGEAGPAPDGERAGLEERARLQEHAEQEFQAPERGYPGGASPDGNERGRQRRAGDVGQAEGWDESSHRSVFGGHARALLDAAFISNTAPGAIWSTGCRLGGALHGLPDGPQHPEGWGWECGVPRVRQDQPHWKERIKAQGNAACPPCAEVVGRLINIHAARR